MSVPSADPPAQLSRMLLDRVPSLLAYFDDTLHCRYANRAYASQAGLPAEAAIGRTMQALVGLDIFEIRRPHVERALAGQMQSFEHVTGAGDSRRHLLVKIGRAHV